MTKGVSNLPNLLVSPAAQPKEIPVDTKVFLYKNASRNPVDYLLRAGRDSTDVLRGRIDFAQRCFEHLCDLKAQGRSPVTVKSKFDALRQFVAFADERRAWRISKEDCLRLFQAWAITMEDRVEAGDMGARAAETYRLRVEGSLKAMFGFHITAIRRGLRFAKVESEPKAEKIGTGVVRGFVDDLVDLISSLSLEAIAGTLPVSTNLSSNQLKIEHWGRARSGTLSAAQISARSLPVEVANLPKLRSGLLNLRTVAEYHLFIANTGCNVGQASAMTDGDFRFQSYKGGYKVRKYKARKGGQVEFWITKGYRPFFEAHLAYRRSAFPGSKSDRLFNVLPISGQGSEAKVVNTESLRIFMRRAGRPYVAPSFLRASKANVVSRITGSSATTALVMQNTVATLGRHYIKTDLPIAISELSRYFEVIDPATKTSTSPVEGACEGLGHPTPAAYASPIVPDPDCVNPKGCLFCIHHRGVSEPGYPWAQLSYAEYLRREVATYKSRRRTKDPHPGVLVIERIADEMNAFALHSDLHRSWVEYARRRVDDEDYHPHWRFYIELLEIAL